MGRLVPPLPLSKEEVERRIAAGAKTLREIDPELCRWADEGQRFRAVATTTLGFAAIVFIISFLVSVLYG